MSLDALSDLVGGALATDSRAPAKSRLDALSDLVSPAPVAAGPSNTNPATVARATVPDATGQALQPVPAVEPEADWRPSNTAAGIGETAATMGSGMAANAMAGMRAMYKRATGAYDHLEAPEDSPDRGAATTALRAQAAEEDAAKYVEEHTYTPRTEEAKKILAGVGSFLKPLEGLGPQSELVAAGAAPGGARAQLADIAAQRGGAPKALIQALGDKGGEFAAPLPASAKVAAQQAAKDPGFISAIVDAMAAQRQGVQVSRMAPKSPRPSPTTPAEMAAAENTPGALAAEGQAAVKNIATGAPSSGLPPPALANFEERAHREALAGRVMGDGATVRPSIISGDRAEAKQLLTESGKTAGNGPALKAILESEKNGLDTSMSRVIENTGGTIGRDEAAREAAGEVGGAFYDKLKEMKDAEKKTLYDTARQRSEQLGVTTNLNEVEGVLNDQNFVNRLASTTDGKALLNSMKKQLDFVRGNNPTGLTVDAAEDFRKYLNDVWTPGTAKTLRTVKNAVDRDVMHVAGEDTFAQARGMHAEHAKIFDDLLDEHFEKGPNGERAVPPEKVIEKISKAPLSTYRKILQVVREAPPEMQAQAQAFESELMAHHANRLHEIGMQRTPESQWNAPLVQRYLMTNNAKMAAAFERHPHLLHDIQDVREFGNIARIDQKYEGAGVQIENMLAAHAAPALEKALSGAGAVTGESIGSALGMPGVGGFVGAQLSKAAQNRVKSNLSARNLRKSMVTVRAAPRTE